jgi:meiotic recombination protein SPO11
LLTADIITTKRDVFYKDVELFGNQREVDRILEDLAVHFQVSRYSLNIVRPDDHDYIALK